LSTPTNNNVLLLGILADITAAMGAIGAGVKVALLQAPFVFTKDTTYAQITAPGILPTYTGYAEQAVAAWGLPYLDPVDGVCKVDGGDLLFIPGDAVTPNTIYAWALVDAMDLTVLQGNVLDNPVPLPDAFHGISIDVIFSLCGEIVSPG